MTHPCQAAPRRVKFPIRHNPIAIRQFYRSALSVSMINAQPIAVTSLSKVLELNNAHAVELSWLSLDGLTGLLAQAFHAAQIGSVDAFLIALDHVADYDSPNYLWFRAQYDRFVYVDRVVVTAQARGRGYARILYTELFRRAHAAGHTLVTCEVNRDPPNPASDAFHARMGFEEVGEAAIHGGSKTVRYLARTMAGN